MKRFNRKFLIHIDQERMDKAKEAVSKTRVYDEKYSTSQLFRDGLDKMLEKLDNDLSTGQ